MVKVDNAGSKVFHWTVIVAFEIHGWFAQLQVVLRVQNVAPCSSINLAINLKDL